MAPPDRGDSTRETGELIPVVATVADERLQAICRAIANGIGVSRDV
jgi:hypothetical protein